MEMPKPEYRIASKFAPACEGASIRAFAGRELAGTDRIFSHIAAGGVAVVLGDVCALDELLVYVNRRKSDLGKISRQDWPEQRLMVETGRHETAGITPPLSQRHLALLCGEDGLEDGESVLVPYAALKSLQVALSMKWQVDALGTWLQAGDDVLAPCSQGTYSLFQQAISGAAGKMKPEARILDMGCGCGVLGFLAIKELSALTPTVVAADILPEAIGSAMLNLERLEREGIMATGRLSVAAPGNLYENAEGEYDLVIFNAPWVLAPVRSRVDVALNDEKQKVLAGFFAKLSDKLRPEGRLILGYADNSGEKAVERALALAYEAGLAVVQEHTLRVATHRKRGKWERIFVWEMARNS
jgi:methylase of polypeptide subunit release factors